MNVITSGQIARQLNIDRDRASYLLRKTKIQPLGKAGIVNLFPIEAVEIVAKLIDVRPLKEEAILDVISQYPGIVA